MRSEHDFTLSARVRAHGPMHQVVDGAHMTLTRKGQDLVWHFRSERLGTEAIIREGEQNQVIVDGIPASPNLVPRPWGLLMRLEDAGALIGGAKPGTVRRQRHVDGSARIECDTQTARVVLEVESHGVVTTLRIQVGGDEVEGVLLEDLVYNTS